MSVRNNTGNFCQFLAGARFQGEAAGIEQHIGHINDQATRSLAGREDDVELTNQFGAHLGSLFFSLLGGGLGSKSISLGLGDFLRETLLFGPLGIGFSGGETGAFGLVSELAILLGDGGGGLSLHLLSRIASLYGLLLSGLSPCC